MGYLHQQLIEILSYAMVITGNHIYTSGGLGTNAAVVRGALRAERPDLLTVILPQSLDKQPEELHELLGSVQNLICMSENDDMMLLEASKCDSSHVASNPPAQPHLLKHPLIHNTWFKVSRVKCHHSCMQVNQIYCTSGRASAPLTCRCVLRSS